MDIGLWRSPRKDHSRYIVWVNQSFWPTEAEKQCCSSRLTRNTPWTKHGPSSLGFSPVGLLATPSSLFIATAFSLNAAEPNRCSGQKRSKLAWNPVLASERGASYATSRTIKSIGSVTMTSSTTQLVYQDKGSKVFRSDDRYDIDLATETSFSSRSQ